MRNIYIGIDPDKGWAEWDPSAGKLLAVDTVDFWEIESRLQKISELSEEEYQIKIFIESPHKIRPTFTENRPEDYKKLSKISQNVGENKAKAKLIVTLCKKLFGAHNVIQMTPNKKSATKWKSKRFKFQTGWQPRTSEHGRDAAMLVFGR